MFEIRISRNSGSGFCKSDQQVRIEGCPKHGVKAVDFRRQHGLPEAPSDAVDLPEFIGESEEFARGLPLDENADVSLGEVKGCWLHQSAEPAAIRAYCNWATAETAAGLMRNILELRARKEKADEEESARKAAELVRAHELLDGEIASAKRQADYWKSEAARLQAEIDSREESEVDAE